MDPDSAIFNIIKEMSSKVDGSMTPTVSLGDIRERIIAKGYTETQLDSCLRSYERDEIWVTNADNTLTWERITGDE